MFSSASFSLAACGLVALAFAANAACPAEAPAPLVAQVIDGDTLDLADGRTVRLAGIMAPKTPQASPTFADAATRALARLIEGQPLRLAPTGAGIDRHGRLLAHVFDREGRWLQAELVRRGAVRVDTLPDGRERAGELLRFEAEARIARRGLWASNAFAVRDPDAARRYVDRFELVEGRVLKASTVAGRVYLNFGADWRSDFTVAVPRENRPSFSGAGLDLRALQGKMIRVRGWIQWRDGPLIEAIHPEQIEVLDP
ncbi:MAG TPA: thermonuclease family protein [Alphaproteobacteria bacterium]|nr:thermonuclease family protein [Alphaproteobacteria bacterium]